jgi:hypothetical protein
MCSSRRRSPTPIQPHLTLLRRHWPPPPPTYPPNTHQLPLPPWANMGI